MRSTTRWRQNFSARQKKPARKPSAASKCSSAKPRHSLKRGRGNRRRLMSCAMSWKSACVDAPSLGARKLRRLSNRFTSWHVYSIGGNGVHHMAFDLRRCVLIFGIMLFVPALKMAKAKPESDDAKSNPVVTGGNEFAFDLYARLARADKNAGKNLCFSPYSVSAALMIASEGARGETAEQIGRVLHFPSELHGAGPANSDVPWDMAPLRLWTTALRAQLTGYSTRPAVRIARARIDILRKALAAANARTQAAIDSGDFDKQSASSEIAQTVATELNSLFLQVDPYELRIANAVWVTQRWPLK